MAVKSNIKNMVLSLTLVCLVCSVLLGGVYNVTAEPIKKAAAARTAASIARVLPPFDSEPQEHRTELGGVQFVYYSVEGAGIAVVSTTAGFGGPLTVMVGIGEDGLIVNSVVLSHSETPGLGAKCAVDEAFRGQFEGFDPASKRLAVTRDGGDIDAITASTISSRAYTAAVAQAYEVYKKVSGNE